MSSRNQASGQDSENSKLPKKEANSATISYISPKSHPKKGSLTINIEEELARLELDTLDDFVNNFEPKKSNIIDIEQNGLNKSGHHKSSTNKLIRDEIQQNNIIEENSQTNKTLENALQNRQQQSGTFSCSNNTYAIVKLNST